MILTKQLIFDIEQDAKDTLIVLNDFVDGRLAEGITYTYMVAHPIQDNIDLARRIASRGCSECRKGNGYRLALVHRRLLSDSLDRESASTFLSHRDEATNW